MLQLRGCSLNPRERDEAAILRIKLMEETPEAGQQRFRSSGLYARWTSRSLLACAIAASTMTAVTKFINAMLMTMTKETNNHVHITGFFAMDGR